MSEPSADLRERLLTDAEFFMSVRATCVQAECDGGRLDPEMVAKVLMAYDRSGVGAQVHLDGSAWPALKLADDEAARRFMNASPFTSIQPYLRTEEEPDA